MTNRKCRTGHAVTQIIGSPLSVFRFTLTGGEAVNEFQPPFLPCSEPFCQQYKILEKPSDRVQFLRIHGYKLREE